MIQVGFFIIHLYVEVKLGNSDKDYNETLQVLKLKRITQPTWELYKYKLFLHSLDIIIRYIF